MNFFVLENGIMFMQKLYKVIVASPKATQEVTKSQNKKP
jgi:hypothetical protein